MSRQERRRAERDQKKKDKAIMVKASDMERTADLIERRMHEQAFEEALLIVLPMMFAVPLLVLRDHYGFSAKKMQNFVGFMGTVIQDFQEQRFTYRELVQVIKDEGKIDLVEVTRGFDMGLKPPEQIFRDENENLDKDIDESISKLLKSKSRPYNVIVCMEELSELSRAISKWGRYEPEVGKTRSVEIREHLIEELADVSIIMDMILQMAGIKRGEVRAEKIDKVKRDIARLELHEVGA